MNQKTTQVSATSSDRPPRPATGSSATLVHQDHRPGSPPLLLGLRWVFLLLAVVAIVLLVVPEEAEATHYRYATLSWEPGDEANEVVFTGQFAARWTFFEDEQGAHPELGDVLEMGPLDRGDGNSAPLHIRVDFIDEDDDWLMGPITEANGDPGISHTYGNPTRPDGSPWKAVYDHCCRLEETDDENINFHVNNGDPGTDIRLETLVDLSAPQNSSPITTLDPIQFCPLEAVCTIPVPVTDPDEDTLSFRMATSQEAVGGGADFIQPGPPDADHEATIDAETGVITWNTTGATFDPNFEFTLYSIQVMIEDGATKVPLDFFIRLTPEPNVTLEKSAQDVTAGENASFQILVTNDGTSNAFNVQLSDTLPVGFDWSHDQDTRCTIDQGTLECLLETLGPGESFRVNITAPTTRDQCGDVFNEATATTANQANESVDSATLRVLCPNLELTKSGQGASAGENVSFTLLIENIGSDTVADVTLSDALPGVLDWEIVPAESHDSCTIEADLLECGPAELGPGASLSVKVTAATTFDDCGLLENEATADAPNHPVLSDTASVTIECPSLQLEKTSTQEQVTAGENMTFTITLTNTGDGTATGATLTDDVPDGLTWTLNEAASHGSCAITSGTLECGPVDLTPGATLTAVVEAPTNSEDCGEIMNTAFADAANHPQTTASHTITVHCPDLQLEKTGTDVNAGEIASFTLALTNNGDGTATGANLTDDLPDGLTWTLNEAASHGSCAITSGTLECGPVDLTPGATLTAVVEAPTNSEDCGEIMNTAFADADNHPEVTANQTITVHCPDLTLDKTGEDANAGQNASFTLTLTNNGAGTATGATLTDTLPSVLSWTLDSAASHDSCTITAGTLDCGPVDLESGAVLTAVVEATTTSDDCGDHTNNASANADNHSPVSASHTITVTCPELQLEKTGDDVIAGETASFTLTLTNNGDGTATGATLTDTLPSGLTWTLDAEASHDSCTITAGTLDCGPVDLTAGENLTATIEATTTSDDCGDHTNQASADADNHPQTTASHTITVHCADLTLEKTGEDVNAGETASFTLTLTNNGEGTATGANLTDDLPSGLTWTLDAAASHGSCAITSGTLECGPVDLAAGETLTAVVESETGFDLCGEYSNSASAVADNHPEVTASHTITVHCPELTLEKTGEDVNAGETTSFTLTLTNNGAGTATGATLTDTLPSGLAWTLDAEASDDSCAITSGTLECGPVNLTTGQTLTATIEATTTSDDCGDYTNNASGSADNHPPVTASHTITVTCPELQLEKTGEDVNAGETTSFTLTLTNNGDGTATGATLTDTLPSGLAWTLDAEASHDSCTITAGTLECGPVNLTAGETLTAIVAAETSGGDCGTHTNSASAGADNHPSITASHTITVSCPELVVEKTAEADTISAGETARFNITVTNPSNATATDVNITDDLPAGLEWTHDQDEGLCTIEEGVLECSIDSIGPGEAFTVQVSAPTTEAECGGLLENTAIVGASNLATSPQDNATITVFCPELNLEKTAENDRVAAGGLAVFTVTVTNLGPVTAFDVHLEDLLPPDLEWDHDRPDVCEISDGILDCLVPSLGPEESFTVTLSATTSHELCDVLLENTASVTASNQESPSEASATIRVVCPELQIQKSSPSGNVTSGEDAVFTITVVNIGETSATNVRVNDSLPSGFDWTHDRPDDCVIADGELVCLLDEMGVGDTFEIELRAPVNPENCRTITNRAQVLADNHLPVTDQAELECLHAQALAQFLYAGVTTPESVEYETHGAQRETIGEEHEAVVTVDTQALLGNTLPRIETYDLTERANISRSHETTEGASISQSTGDLIAHASTTASETRLLDGMIVIGALHNEALLRHDPETGARTLETDHYLAHLEILGEQITLDGEPMDLDLPGGGHLKLFTNDTVEADNETFYRSRIAHLLLPVRLDPETSALPEALQTYVTANVTTVEIIIGEVQVRISNESGPLGQHREILEDDDAGSDRDATSDEAVHLRSGVYEGSMPDGDPRDVYTVDAETGDLLAVVLEPAVRVAARGGAVMVGEDIDVELPQTNIDRRDYRVRVFDPDGTILTAAESQHGAIPAVILLDAMTDGPHRIVVDSPTSSPAANYTLTTLILKDTLAITGSGPSLPAPDPVQAETSRSSTPVGL